MSYTQVLEATFHNRLDPNTLNELRTVAKVCTYPKGTVLCHQGENEHTFYIVVEGQVAASQQLEDNETRLLGMIGPNQHFGEMGLIDDQPRMATCTTLTDTTVLEITEEVFDILSEKSPALAFNLTQNILRYMRQLDDRSIDDLRLKNEALKKAYADLQAAQVKLVEKERMERELELAAVAQESMLPNDLPQYPDYGIAAYLQPARRVGGDFYDVIDIDNEHIGLLIADVADKGIHAALFMAVMRTLFYTEGRYSLSPAKVALAVHRGMLDVAPNTDVFVTAFYGVLHRPSGRLTYVRAGHEKPLYFRPGQSIDTLPGDGRFLGMLEELELSDLTFQLLPGDRLVLFSDGVPDAINNNEEFFGKERFAASLEASGSLPATDIVQRIVNDVASFCQGTAPFDDLTLLVVEAK